MGMLLFEDHRYEAAAVVHKAVVYAVAFSPDGSMLATVRDGSVFVRDANGHVTSLLERGVKEQPVHALGYLPGSSSLVVGGSFGWSGYKQDGGAWREFGAKLSQQVTSLAVLTDRLVAVGTGDRVKATGGTFEIWDVVSDTKKTPYFHEPNGVRSISAAPLKKIVAWATGHRKVRVWDITSPAKPLEFPQPCDSPAVALSTDGAMLAVANDWNAKIIDLKTKRERGAEGAQGAGVVARVQPGRHDGGDRQFRLHGPTLGRGDGPRTGELQVGHRPRVLRDLRPGRLPPGRGRRPGACGGVGRGVTDQS